MTGLRQIFWLFLLPVAGCMMHPTPELQKVIVKKTAATIQLDGSLNEDSWRHASCYSFLRPRSMAADRLRQLGPVLCESATVRLLFDEEYLYIGFELEDGDQVARRDRDQAPQWKYGDVVEIFLKHRDHPQYFEFHITPLGRKTSLLIPACGMWELVDYFPQQAMPGFEVAVWNDGTVNNHTDRDHSWTVEARIPLKELAKYGSPLQTGATGWTVLFARHNYGNSIAAREPSSFPQCPGLNFHVPELFLPLDFHEIKENTGISPR